MSTGRAGSQASNHPWHCILDLCYGKHRVLLFKLQAAARAFACRQPLAMFPSARAVGARVRRSFRA
eukprot:366166-Chlamydomonas_euryale.AAC.11